MQHGYNIDVPQIRHVCNIDGVEMTQMWLSDASKPSFSTLVLTDDFDRNELKPRGIEINKILKVRIEGSRVFWRANQSQSSNMYVTRNTCYSTCAARKIWYNINVARHTCHNINVARHICYNIYVTRHICYYIYAITRVRLQRLTRHSALHYLQRRCRRWGVYRLIRHRTARSLTPAVVEQQCQLMWLNTDAKTNNSIEP